MSVLKLRGAIGWVKLGKIKLGLEAGARVM